LETLPPSDLVDEFLSRSVFAVAGVSSNAEKYGTIAWRALRAAGKRAYGINPRLKSLDGETIYPSVASLPECPDVLSLVVPARIGLDLVKEAVEMGVERVWMQPGAESPELIEWCAESGISAIHNQCVMVQLALRGNRPEAP
jgi:predicted CoA-binding protein